MATPRDMMRHAGTTTLGKSSPSPELKPTLSGESIVEYGVPGTRTCHSQEIGIDLVMTFAASDSTRTTRMPDSRLFDLPDRGGDGLSQRGLPSARIPRRRPHPAGSFDVTPGGCMQGIGQGGGLLWTPREST